MSILVTGGIELQGLVSVAVSVPTIQPYHQVVLKGVSEPLVGTIVLSEITTCVGFDVSSTHPKDTGKTLYFDVVEIEGSRQRCEAKKHTCVEAIFIQPSESS